jgi:two-component system LytT family response regulator
MSPQPEPLRVIVADDEALARRGLCRLLAQEPDFVVIAETGNGIATIDAVRTNAPDVLFLDVRMPGANGIEVIEAIGPDAAGAVVLVTAFDDYAVAAFEHHALDYVLKPVDEDRFRTTVARVRERIRQQRAARFTDDTLRALMEAHQRASDPPDPYPSRIVVRNAGKTTIVEVSDIDWFEAAGDYVALHTGATVHFHRTTMSALEQRLDPAEFVRIHRSTLVRISRVRELQPFFHGDHCVILRDGTRMRLSRTYRARLQAALGQRL